MTEQSFVYVMVHDNGVEGYSTPMQCFLRKDDARTALATANRGRGTRHRLFRVPLWPQPAVDQYDLEPVEF